MANYLKTFQLAFTNSKEANTMLFHEFIQTTAALSGLICLMIGLQAVKKQLKFFL